MALRVEYYGDRKVMRGDTAFTTTGATLAITVPFTKIVTARFIPRDAAAKELIYWSPTISAGAITVTRSKFRRYIRWNQDGNVTNTAQLIDFVPAAGTVTSVKVGCGTAPTGDAAADLQVKHGTTPTELLGGTGDKIILNATNIATALTAYSATLATAANLVVAAGAAIQVVIANASAGTGALGIDTAVAIAIDDDFVSGLTLDCEIVGY